MIKLINFNKLDIEFAIDKNNNVNIFQVRPIVVDHTKYDYQNEVIERNIKDNSDLYQNNQPPSSNILGSKVIYSNMSDWIPLK